MATESTEEHGKIKSIKVKKLITNKMRVKPLKNLYATEAHGKIDPIYMREGYSSISLALTGSCQKAASFLTFDDNFAYRD